QKLRITKINEMPHPFIFAGHGLELIGNKGLAKLLGGTLPAIEKTSTKDTPSDTPDDINSTPSFFT
ncbi:MAG: hypothetical protein QSU88_02580, partial [Candidatus Methanoperedens sp.]|nr:hypothetical protein [Candidatus Methanoperedens sp.]